MVSREINNANPDKTTSDSAFWQRGRIADTSLRALEEVGLLGELHEEVTERGTRMIRYPTPEQATRQATYESVDIKQVWFNRAIAGNPTPPKIKDIDPAHQKQHQDFR
jgi:hypothetical protein